MSEELTGVGGSRPGSLRSTRPGTGPDAGLDRAHISSLYPGSFVSPFSYIHRPHFGVIFVPKCACLKKGPKRAPFCMGIRAKNVDRGPASGGPEISFVTGTPYWARTLPTARVLPGGPRDLVCRGRPWSTGRDKVNWSAEGGFAGRRGSRNWVVIFISPRRPGLSDQIHLPTRLTPRGAPVGAF